MSPLNEAKEFERTFTGGRGIIPTPVSWIEQFWDVHRDKVVALMKPSFSRAGTVLFVGVGSGDVIPRLQPAGKRIIGIDLNRAVLEQASQHCEAIEGDGSSLPLPDNSCDLVICNMVLHHIVVQGGLEVTIKESSRVLKKGGSLLIFEPNLFHPSGMAMTLLNKFRLYHAVAGGSNYEYALSPWMVGAFCRRYFTRIDTGAITFSHPRFPPFLQRALFRLDGPCAGWYPFSFSFRIEAVK